MYTSRDALPLMDDRLAKRYYDAADEIEAAYTHYRGYAKEYFGLPGNDAAGLVRYMETEHPETLELAKLRSFYAGIKKMESGLKGASPDEQRAMDAEIAARKYELLEKYGEAKERE